MMTRRFYWTAAILWVVLIYSTLYIVRPICDFLTKHTPLSLLINLLIIGVLAFIFFFKIMRLGLRSVLLFLLIAAIYGIGLFLLELPAERVHFLEYGFLAFLLYRAFRFDHARMKSFWFSFLLCTLIGFGDEGIQELLPNRYYELRDVGLNAVSSLLGLFVTLLFRKDEGLKKN